MMTDLNNNSLEKDWKTVAFSDSQEDSQINTYLQGLIYHQNIELLLSLHDSLKMSQIGKSLVKLSQLNGLRIIVKQNSLHLVTSIRDILRSFQQFPNLKELKFELQNQSENIYFNQTITELANSISQLSQLEVLSIDIPDFSSIEEEGKQAFVSAFKNFKNFKNFKVLKLKMTISNNEMQEILNEILQSINNITSLTVLDYQISSIRYYSPKQSLWSFDSLANLQELQIISDQFCKYSVARIGEQIRQLQALIRLTIRISTQNEQNQFCTLMNNIFNLVNLEELEISFQLLSPDIQIVIGESVYQDSKLKKFKFSAYKNYLDTCKISLIVGKNIVNVKHLETLSLDVRNCVISGKTFEVLSQWKDQLTNLKEFQFFNQYINSQYETENIHSFLRKCFSTASQIIWIEMELDMSSIFLKGDILQGLAQLSNLQALSCTSLYEKNNVDIQKQYVNCFKNLTNLRALSIQLIMNAEEVICISHSLSYMTSLETLKLNFSVTPINTENLEIFCPNLIKLQNLKHLCLKSGIVFGSFEVLKTPQCEILLKSLASLKNINELDLLIPAIAEESKKIFKNEILRIISALQQLHILSIHRCQFNENKRRILRNSKRLVKLSSS